MILPQLVTMLREDKYFENSIFAQKDGSIKKTTPHPYILIVQALPGLGKSFNQELGDVDTDDWLGVIDMDDSDRLSAAIDFAEDNQSILYTSYWVQELSEFTPDIIIGIDNPENYISRAKAGRKDLIELFGDQKLKSWVQDYQNAFSADTSFNYVELTNGPLSNDSPTGFDDSNEEDLHYVSDVITSEFKEEILTYKGDRLHSNLASGSY